MLRLSSKTYACRWISIIDVCLCVVKMSQRAHKTSFIVSFTLLSTPCDILKDIVSSFICFNYLIFDDFRRKLTTVVKATSRVDKFSKTDIIVSPSILSANFAKLGEQVLYYILISATSFQIFFIILLRNKDISVFQVPDIATYNVQFLISLSSFIVNQSFCLLDEFSAIHKCWSFCSYFV